MKKDDHKPQPESAGAAPPPRPPRRTAVAHGPGDDDPEKANRKKVVPIKLPPKPSVASPVKPPVTLAN